MRHIVVGGLLLLAGICILLWLTMVGMFYAFAGGMPPLSFDELRDRPLAIGLFYLLPLFAAAFGSSAFWFWKKLTNARN